MLSAAELLLVFAATLALVGYCLKDAIAARREHGASVVWIVLLAAGIVIWPLGWVTSAVYLRRRRALRSV